MSSRTRDLEGLIGATEVGDRTVASVLSALAEAPDFPSASSFLLAQVLDLTDAERGHMLLLDTPQETLVSVANLGYESAPAAAISVGDLSNPLVLCALALAPVAGDARSSLRAFVSMSRWIWLLLMSTPTPEPTLPAMPTQQAQELLGEGDVRLLSPVERRLASAPGGVIVVEGGVPEPVVGSVTELVMLAGPIIARLASLQESRDTIDRLSQQRDRLTLMVDSLPDPVVITNATNDIIAQNARAERLLIAKEGDSSGRRRAIELNNLLFTSFLSKAVMTGGQSSGARELNLVDPDEGNDLLFEVLAHPLSELERQVLRVRLAEQKSSSERDRLNLILENVADPILVTDERANIILMNEQAEQLFQASEMQLRSRRQLQAVRGNDTKFTSFISEFALLDTRARRERVALVHPVDGSQLPVEVVSGKILNERGEPIAIVSVLHDLTKEVEIQRLYETLKTLNSELEERIRLATADLAEQNARLQWQSQEVERANRLKSEFLASMSHELRTPINALIGYSALLIDGVLGDINDRQRDALRRGRAAAEHLLALINDILDLAKIEAGKMPLHLEDVALRDVIAEVAQQIEPMVRKKALEFVVDVGVECPALHTDRTKVRQVLLNLLSNAVKFTNKGRVSVVARCAETGDGVRIDVVDSGIGIHEKDLQAIWEDFRQVDQSRTREYGGTGLGLSITRKLLDRLGGTVTVRSKYGEGSVFSVVLPQRTPVTAGEEIAAGRPG